MSQPLRLALFLLVGLSASAQANVDLPTILPFGFVMLAALLRFIGVEAWVLSAQLGEIRDEAFGLSFDSKIASTIVGFALAWLLGAVARGVLETISDARASQDSGDNETADD